jgi:hypothetical protein
VSRTTGTVRTLSPRPDSETKLLSASACGVPEDVVSRIVRAYRAGEGWSAIARTLNDEGTPTAHGGTKWYPSTVRAIVLANAKPAA